MHLFVIPEMDQLKLYFLIIQESKLVFSYFDPLADAGSLVQFIIIAEIFLVQDLVHHFAAFTAEFFFFQLYFIIDTGFPAMITMKSFIYNGF